MKTIAEVLSLSTAFLSERKIERARRCVEELLAFSIGVKRIDLYLQHDRPLIESELENMRLALKRCALGEPLEQILGEIEFYHCRIAISRDVLIPRPETEVLVDTIVKKLKGIDLQGKTLWDLCTGSGCIGLALKKAFPQLSVTLSDSCPKALAIAKNNSEKNQLSIGIRQGDLLEPFREVKERVDFIVCNPPYVSQKEFDLLDQGVREFEPKCALLAGEKGTEFYERLAVLLPSYLQKGGQAFFEIGSTQGAAVQALFGRGKLMKDWAGHDRFFFLEIE